jgi:hypothetical protein
MDAGLGDLLFWGPLAIALAVAWGRPSSSIARSSRAGRDTRLPTRITSEQLARPMPGEVRRGDGLVSSEPSAVRIERQRAQRLRELGEWTRRGARARARSPRLGRGRGKPRPYEVGQSGSGRARIAGPRVR